VVRAHLAREPAVRPEYVELVDVARLEPLAVVDGATPMVLAVAAHVGPARLIDNLVVDWDAGRPRCDLGVCAGPGGALQQVAGRPAS
jgi:hypothetical protein